MHQGASLAVTASHWGHRLLNSFPLLFTGLQGLCVCERVCISKKYHSMCCHKNNNIAKVLKKKMKKKKTLFIVWNKEMNKMIKWAIEWQQKEDKQLIVLCLKVCYIYNKLCQDNCHIQWCFNYVSLNFWHAVTHYVLLLMELVPFCCRLAV